MAPVPDRGRAAAGSLIVTDVRVTESGPGVRLSCRLEADDLGLPPTFWIDLPPELAPTVSASGDPFLPPLLLVAMRHRRRLVIESHVSAALLDAVPRLMMIYAQRADAGNPFAPVDVVATPACRWERGAHAGAFFSGGVDSFYTLLRNNARYPRADSRSISHLILVHGWDFPLERADFFDTVRREAQRVADELERTLVWTRTNVRQVVGGIDWGNHAYGAGLASIGLSLAWFFHTVFIPGGVAILDPHHGPTGAHPGLDPLWSTERLELVHDGAETTRSDKIRAIAATPLALEVLRVCWESEGETYNCGRCAKCLTTMVELELIGALARAKRLPDVVEPTIVAGLVLPPGRIRSTRWAMLLERLRREGGRPELITAIETALRAGMVSRAMRLDRSLSRGLIRIGLSRDRIAALDRRVMAGAGRALYRRILGLLA
jgi:hypothetical protein